MADVRSTFAIGLKDETKKGADSIQRSLKSIKDAADGLSGPFRTLGSIGVVAGFAAITKSAIELGDRLKDMSTSTGASVEQLSFLNFAAKQSGTDLSGVAVGIAKMQKALADVSAKGTGPAAEAFEKLGLNAKELSQLNLIDQFTSIGKALSQIQSPAQRTQVAMDIFGKSARGLLPLLLEADGGLAAMRDRFVELGGVITKDQANKFDDMNDAIGELQVASQGAGAAIGEVLAPAIAGLARVIADEAPSAAKSFKDFIDNGIYGSLQFAQKIVEIKGFLSDFFTIHGPRGAVKEGDLSVGAKKAIEDSKAIQRVLDQIQKDHDEQEINRAKAKQRTLDAINKGGVSGAAVDGDGTDKAAVAKAKREADAFQKSQDDAVSALERRLVAEKEVTEVARTKYEIEKGAFKTFNEDVKKRLLGLSDELDAQKESAEVEEYMIKLAEERRAAAGEATKAQAEERRKTIESLRSAQEVYVDTINDLIRQGIGGDTLQRGIKKAKDELDSANDKANKLKDTAKDLGLTFSSAFEDAVIEGKKLGEVLKGLIADFARIILRKTVTEPLANATGQFFEGLFGNAKGGLYKVGGSGSEHTVAFNARAGEVVAVGTSMSGGGEDGGVVINNYSNERVDARKRNVAGRRQLEVTVGELMSTNVSAGRGASLGLNPQLAPR